MRKVLLSAVALGVFAAAPAAAQQAEGLRYVGGTGPNATLSSAVIVDDMIYLSGVLPSREAGEGIQEQTRSVMETIQAQLAELGASMENVVKCTVYMADLAERPQLNEVYRTYFPENRRPARSAVGVDLGGPKVEIECMALMPD